jgi:hypothetical protein
MRVTTNKLIRSGLPRKLWDNYRLILSKKQHIIDNNDKLEKYLNH